MARHLNLVQSDFEKMEKLVLPRFPFCYMVFKAENSALVFEVKDISKTGMQLALKDGQMPFKEEMILKGELHWGIKRLSISGTVKWSSESRIGVEFSNRTDLRLSINDFLTVENFAKQMRSLHNMELAMDLPPKLKYWLRSDGPVELFVWQHSDGELSGFQVIFMENFVEWKDGKGLSTGRVMSKRDVDTPLLTEDEFVFKIDPVIDDSKINLVLDLIGCLSADSMNQNVINFMSMKLGRTH